MSSAQDRRRERERMEELRRAEALVRVTIEGSRYGYTLNLGNPVLLALYEAYKKHEKIHGAPSDSRRFLWETAVKTHICAEYKEMYHTALYQPIIGWQKERLEECVRVMDIEKAEKRILQLTANRKIIAKAEETYLKYRKVYV